MKPFLFARILVPTDLSESSLPAVRYARMFADRFAAKVTVLYVEPIAYPVAMAGPASGLYLDTMTAANPERLRDEVEQHVRTPMSGRPYEIEVTVGQPVPSIVAAAAERNADLIIMGTHLRRGWRRTLLGSVSEGVLHGSECPVLIVAAPNGSAGATSVGAVTRILCPVNFTEVARESLQAAGQIARAFSAHLTIVHVLEAGEVTDFRADEQRVRSWVEPELQDRCTYRELVVHGGAAERVLDCADDLRSDLLVIGAQHRLFRDATIVGATTERLIRFAPCPVLVVPREAAHRDSKVEAEPELAGAER